jgi:hypothetical protein
MAVVNLAESREFFGAGLPACSMCGETVRAPFLWWRNYRDNCPDLFVCLKCCGEDGRSLALDLVQMEAIVRMRAVAPDSYASVVTLDRGFNR